jgi:scyllo-inositol 2-dehydrogenase (NADP+)
MRVIVVGLGIQGKKRADIAGKECVATVDPYHSAVSYKNVRDAPLNSFDAALVCTPDECKIDILEYLLTQGKHVLVEKPLLDASTSHLERLQSLAKERRVSCYTAYNHRFEPHFVRMKELIESDRLGQIYHCRMFYGNGTARDVRNSPWRDQNAGVLPDLGSHLLDTLLFWFGSQHLHFQLHRARNFENKSPDHVLISSDGFPTIDLEMSLLSWRNHFTCDIIAERGSAHIESLCKWGPTKFTLRHRKLPSGKPDEESITLAQPDPTWALEYQYFKEICAQAQSNLSNDIVINQILQNLTHSVLLGAKP